MILSQRDVVEVYFTFPHNSESIHPVVVLSVPSVLNCENTFIGVPISHSAKWKKNKFSFPIANNDFERPLKYNDSHIRLHLVTVIRIEDVYDNRVINRMEHEVFNIMFDQLLELVFGCQ